jgi:hypothetical protein
VFWWRRVLRMFRRSGPQHVTARPLFCCDSFVCRRRDSSRMESPPTRLEASGCIAWITCDDEELPVYKIERSTTAWGGEKVEGYIESTAGSRFRVGMESSRERSRKAPDVLGDVLLDGTCMRTILRLSSRSQFAKHLWDQGQAGKFLRQNAIVDGRARTFLSLSLSDSLC